MTIATTDDLINALANKRQKLWFGKTSTLLTQTIGGPSSFWKLSGMPGVGATPTSAATCNNTTAGGIPWTNPTGSDKTFLFRMAVSSTQPGSYELHDRLAHMGGLSGSSVSVQTVGLSLLTLSSTDNISNRIGASDYSRVQWFIECFSGLGATAATATVSYTNQSGSSGQTVAVGIPGSTSIGRLVQISPNAGDFIRSIESLTLNQSTGAGGNFGIVARVQRAEITAFLSNITNIIDWNGTGLPQIFDSS